MISYTENLLHYVWKYRLFNPVGLVTHTGEPVEIIDTGLHNSHAGADFFNAKVKIGDKLWAGNVEIHLRSDDWYRHGHHTDKAYNSVILHVVDEIKGDVANEKGRSIPQMKLPIAQHIKQNAQQLLQSEQSLPCKAHIPTINRSYIRSWLDNLMIERLERKTNDIEQHLDRFNNSWDQTFYVLLTRNFGFGLNASSFERLALSLQYNIIQKHTNNLFQVEALLFGQAGMLQSADITDEYYLALQKEYNFLRHKYQLTPIEEHLFKKLRVRPGAFPQIRIAQLAALFQQSGRLFSSIIQIEDYRVMRMHFQSQVSEYWKTHYTFGRPSPSRPKAMGESSLDLIIINTVVPLLFAYGKKSDQATYCERALTILEQIKAERNSIVNTFAQAGIPIESAYDSQAAIQLKREYCDPRKCLYCQIGYKVLSKTKHY